MRGLMKRAGRVLLIVGGLALAPIAGAADPATVGRNVLNAGPDPRVQLDGLSRDHAAIFGTQDEDEQAVLDQERAVQTSRINCGCWSGC